MKKLLLVEAIIIVATLLLFCIPLKNYSYTGEDFSSEKAVLMDELLDVHEKGYYVDNGMVSEEDNDDSGDETAWAKIISPETDLRFGSYNITFKYLTADHSNTYTTNSLYNTIPVVLGRRGAGLSEIERADQNMVITLNSPLNVKGYKVSFNFTGNGYLYVYGLEIQETNWWKWYILFWLVVLFIAVDCVVYWRKAGNTAALGMFAIVLVLTFLSSMPLFDAYLYKGHDFPFHSGRFEALAEAIRNGQIPARISSAWIDGKGYAASIFYCDLFFTMSAVLRVLGASLQFAVKVYVFGINLLTSIIAVKCFSKIFKDRIPALLAAAVFVLAPYRLNCVYVRFATGEYTAIAFIPLVFWGLVKIYRDERGEDKLKDKIRRVLPLAIGASGMVCSHVLTCVIVALFVVVFVLINYKKTFTLKVLTDFLCAVVLVLLINIWYIVPFIQVMHDGIRATSTHYDGRFRSNGTYLWQLFSVFPNYGMSFSIEEGNPEIRNGEMSTSIGPAAWALLLYVILRMFNYINRLKQGDSVKTSDRLCVVAAVLILMETPYFPWDAVKQFSAITNMIVTNIQFPFRFLGITMLCLSVLIGYMYEQIKSDESALVGISSVFLGSVLVTVLLSANYIISDFGANGKFDYIPDEFNDYTVMGAEYLPKGIADDYESISTPTGEEGIEIADWHRENGRIYVSVINNSSEEKMLHVPFLYYRGYRAKELAGTDLTVVKDDNAFVGVVIPNGYEGDISVYYKEPFLWRISEIISILTILLIAGLYVRNTYVRNIYGVLGLS